MANNFSSTISDLLFPPSSTTQNFPKDISTTTPALNMGLAQTLGHFHTLLAPPKSKKQSNNNTTTASKPKQQKSPSKLPSPYSSASIKKNSLSASGKSRSQISKVGSIETKMEEKQTNNEKETEEKDKEIEDIDDEESDTATAVNLDYSVSEFDDDDDDSIASLQISKTVSKDGTILQPVPVPKKDDSVDIITEFVINKL